MSCAPLIKTKGSAVGQVLQRDLEPVFELMMVIKHTSAQTRRSQDCQDVKIQKNNFINPRGKWIYLITVFLNSDRKKRNHDQKRTT